jgi:hypothetical protein
MTRNSCLPSAGISFFSINKIILLAFFFFSTPAILFCSSNTISLNGNGVTVQSEELSRGVAEEVIDIFPIVKGELEKSLGWSITFHPTVVLIRDSKSFRKLAGNEFIVAYAIPEQYLIVIDLSKANIRPFSLKATLKHELSHLLLHHYIRRDNLPKWLDEGVSQWASGGLSELIVDTKKSVLKEAVLGKRLLPISHLNRRFPGDRASLTLAYEESKSFVEYLNRYSGARGLIELLNLLRKGIEIDRAVRKTFAVQLYSLEEKWTRYIAKSNNQSSLVLSNS